MPEPFRARGLLLASVLFLFAIVSPAFEAQQSATLDPASASVEFTLSATLHTVHGTFRMKHGEIQFDPATGKTSGTIVLDATSADTGNSSRDRTMHANVLESVKYPEIVFSPEQIASPGNGKLQFPLPVGATQLEITGVFRLHGQDHEMAVPLAVVQDAGGKLEASAHFSIPYVQWGLKNPSNFFLHVGDTVDLDVRAHVQLSP